MGNERSLKGCENCDLLRASNLTMTKQTMHLHLSSRRLND